MRIGTLPAPAGRRTRARGPSSRGDPSRPLHAVHRLRRDTPVAARPQDRRRRLLERGRDGARGRVAGHFSYDPRLESAIADIAVCAGFPGSKRVVELTDALRPRVPAKQRARRDLGRARRSSSLRRVLRRAVDCPRADSSVLLRWRRPARCVGATGPPARDVACVARHVRPSGPLAVAAGAGGVAMTARGFRFALAALAVVAVLSARAHARTVSRVHFAPARGIAGGLRVGVSGEAAAIRRYGQPRERATNPETGATWLRWQCGRGCSFDVAVRKGRVVTVWAYGDARRPSIITRAGTYLGMPASEAARREYGRFRASCTAALTKTRGLLVVQISATSPRGTVDSLLMFGDEGGVSC